MRAQMSAAIGIALALCASGGAWAQHDRHAANDAAEALAITDAAPPLFSADDVQFLQHMIMHHQQAVDMGALVRERSDRDAFRRFARYVADAQRAEIRMMQGMLESAAERGVAVPDHAHTMHSDPPMAGMLSSTELSALETATGEEFERLWLQGMIVHHDGGLAMARVQQLVQLAAGRRPPGLDVMVEDILDVQRAEITMMQGFLEEWDLVPGEPVDARAPAAELISPAQGGALRARWDGALYGVAVDDRDIATVDVAIQDLASGLWLRSDGTWGERELQPTTIVGSGPASLAWIFGWAPPAPGRYSVDVEVEDAAGKRVAAEPREIEAQ